MIGMWLVSNLIYILWWMLSCMWFVWLGKDKHQHGCSTPYYQDFWLKSPFYQMDQDFNHNWCTSWNSPSQGMAMISSQAVRWGDIVKSLAGALQTRPEREKAKKWKQLKQTNILRDASLLQQYCFWETTVVL